MSVGVSWNKIFAKFGSDFRKPDAITFITPQNYRCRVWEAPVSELLYVGAATRAKLHSSGIDRIGELACASPELLRRRLGLENAIAFDLNAAWARSGLCCARSRGARMRRL